MSKVLSVENLNKEYGKVLAVNDVSFEISKGEIFGLLGPNGAGKSSIISCIVTLEKIDSGKIKVFEFDVEKEPLLAKCHMGFVPQDLVHHGFFSVEEILEIHSGYYGIINNKSKIEYLLKSLGLWDHKDKKVRQLSGGMKRRLLVAKALVHEPKLLLLDEPTAGVDIELRESLWKFVEELKKEGVSILLTTHYLEEAEKLCDRVGIINNGRIIKMGPTRELIKELTSRHISYVLNGEKFSFNIPYSKPIADFFKEKSLGFSDLQDLSIREGSLEEAFKNILEVDKK
jgi:ABC-2 type transport system ATP-binding protein